MASYTTEKQKLVEEIIDMYTSSTLDNYIRATVKDVAITKMMEGASAIEVADAVFDYINGKHSGSTTMAMLSQQICPKSILLLLRNDIIAKLK